MTFTRKYNTHKWSQFPLMGNLGYVDREKNKKVVTSDRVGSTSYFSL